MLKTRFSRLSPISTNKILRVMARVHLFTSPLDTFELELIPIVPMVNMQCYIVKNMFRFPAGKIAKK